MVQSNKIRPIFHLSAPTKQATSVNDSLDPLLKTVTYITFLQIVQFIHNLGKNSLIWVADMKDAYMHVPVHPSDWRYLGLTWYQKTYFLTCLPFGLSSSCRIYENCGDILIWALSLLAPTLFSKHTHHYLDDFFGGHTNPTTAHSQYQAFLHLCQKLGFTVKTKKCHKPSTTQQILGWIYNTKTLKVYAPLTKILQYLGEVDKALNSNAPLPRDFWESLLGKLRWLCTVYTICRVWVINLHYMVHNPSWKYKHTQKPPPHLISDLLIWRQLLSTMKIWGQSFTLLLGMPTKITTVHTDASTSWGLGAWFKNSYTAFALPKSILKSITKNNSPDIQYLECLGVLMALDTYKDQLRNTTAFIWCDNIPVVYNTNKMLIKQHRIDLLFLLQKISYLLITHNITIKLYYIPSDENTIADLVSRGHIQQAITHHYNNTQKPLTKTPPNTQLLTTCLNNYTNPNTIKHNQKLIHHAKQFHNTSFFSFLT